MASIRRWLKLPSRCSARESRCILLPIGRMTTELVIRQLAEWRDAGFELHPVSVNFSSNQLSDTGYVDYLEEDLAA